jgi:hypothetical protein
MIGERNILDDFVIKFTSIVEKHMKYVVVSGFFAIASGRTRGTEDVDIIVEHIDLAKFRTFHKDLETSGFSAIQPGNPEELYGDYLSKNLSVRYIYNGLDLPNMELKLAKDKLDDLQIENRQKYGLTGLDVWFSSVNVCIAFKEELLKSKKDQEDAEHIRLVYSDIVTESEIKKYKELIRRYRL